MDGIAQTMLCGLAATHLDENGISNPQLNAFMCGCNGACAEVHNWEQILGSEGQHGAEGIDKKTCDHKASALLHQECSSSD